MSTSLLYHGFGLIGYTYVKTAYEGGEVIFTIAHKRDKLHCPACGSRDLVLRGCSPRRFRLVPIGSKAIFLDLDVQRIACRRCDTVRKKTFSRPALKDLRYLAIDEIAVKKGLTYVTVALDLESGAVIFVGDGKGADALIPFWKRLRHSRVTVEAVALDRSPAYMSAVMKRLPNATIVFYHFHVVKLFNDKLSNLRRELYRETKDQRQKDVLKVTRWLLLKNPGNLDEEKAEKEHLDEALRMDEPLYTAYYLKEDLREVWNQPSKEKATKVLDEWFRKASSSSISILKTLSKMLSAYKSGILAHYDFPISTDLLKGTNDKIKTMKRQAYGFRDMEFFKLKIMGLHETKYALVG